MNNNETEKDTPFKKLYDFMVTNGICVGCRTRYTLKGRVQCQACLKKSVKRSEKMRGRDGACSRCGSMVGVPVGYKTCDKCRISRKDFYRLQKSEGSHVDKSTQSDNNTI